MVDEEVKISFIHATQSKNITVHYKLIAEGMSIYDQLLITVLGVASF